MCPPMWAHWCHLANTTELVLLSYHPNPQPKQQVERFSRFCTADCRKSLYFTMGDPFPKNCPFSWGSGFPYLHLIHDSLGKSKPTIQMASQSVQPFSHRLPLCPYTLQWAYFSPSKLPLPKGHLDPNVIHGSLGPPESSTQVAS